MRLSYHTVAMLACPEYFCGPLGEHVEAHRAGNPDRAACGALDWADSCEQLAPDVSCEYSTRDGLLTVTAFRAFHAPTWRTFGVPVTPR